MKFTHILGLAILTSLLILGGAGIANSIDLETYTAVAFNNFGILATYVASKIG